MSKYPAGYGLYGAFANLIDENWDVSASLHALFLDRTSSYGPEDNPPHSVVRARGTTEVERQAVARIAAQFGGALLSKIEVGSKPGPDEYLELIVAWYSAAGLHIKDASDLRDEIASATVQVALRMRAAGVDVRVVGNVVAEGVTVFLIADQWKEIYDQNRS